MRAQSVTNAPPTSDVNGTRTPRNVTTAVGLVTRVGALGGESSPTLKPGTPVYGFGSGFMVIIIVDEVVVVSGIWVVE